ncbi:MAG: serine hydrolase [Acidobacteriota bacterium]
MRRSMVVVLLCSSLALATAGHGQVDLGGWQKDAVASGDVEAIAAAIVEKGEVRVLAAGSATAETQFQIGSVTKPFTNLLLAEMVATGDVTYETTVGSILGESFQPENVALREITLLDLATHTSGLPRLPVNFAPSGPDPYASYGVDELMAGLQTTRAKQPLGDFYAYSNFGAGLLGHLLGRVDGSGYAEALQARVLKPLGLDNTSFVPRDGHAEAFTGGQRVASWTFQDSTAAAGALWSTVGDLAKVIQAYVLTDKPAQTDKPRFRHDTAKDFAITSDAGPFAVTPVWHVAGEGLFWHNGRTAGHGGFLGFRPETGEGVVILVAGDADVTGQGLRFLGHESGETAATGAVDERLFGQYRLTPAFGLGIFAEQDVLKVQATGQGAFELHPVNDEWYALGMIDASIRLVTEGDKVVAVELAQGGALQRAEKVADVADVASRQSVEMSREALAEYVGTYALAPGVVFTLRLGDDGLEAQITGQSFLPIYPQGDDVFFYKVVDAELHFERGEGGVIEALVLHQGGLEQRAERQEEE